MEFFCLGVSGTLGSLGKSELTILSPLSSCGVTAISTAILILFQILRTHLSFYVRGSKGESIIYIYSPKRREPAQNKKKNQKAAKIKYSPAHAFTPGEGLREETSSCRYFLHCSDSIMIKKCHKVEQHREQNLFGLQSVWRICQGWYLPSVREVESVSCYCNLQSVTSCIPAAVRERCLRRVAFSPPPAYPLAEVLYLHSCTDF